jgi:RecB family exonuclease
MTQALTILRPQVPIPGRDYELNLPKGYLSFSQIDAYLRCPQAYYRTYVLDGPRINSAEAFEGTCMAKTLEEMGNRKLKGRKMVVARAVEWHKNYLVNHLDDVNQWNDQKPADLVKRGDSFLKRFWKQEEPLITKERLVAVEHGFEIELAGVPVRGVIDLLERNYCWDYKVRSKNSMRYLNVDRSLQLSLYAVATGKEKVGYIVFVKDDGSIVHKQSVRDLSRTKKWLEFTVSQVAQGISKGAFMPCNPADNFLCSSKWCPFFSECAGSKESGI